MKFLLLWTEPLGEVHNSKISAGSLEFYSKARENKVIKLFIIWLQIGKAREIEGTFYIAFIFRHNFVTIIKFRKEISILQNS